MQHDYFGQAMAHQDAHTLARWLAVAGAAPAELRALLEGRGEAGDFEAALDDAGRRGAVAVSLPGARRIAQLMDAAPVRERVLTALPGWWARLAAGGPVTLLLSGAAAELDRPWLAGVLTGPGAAASVWFEARAAGAGLWEWPLRIGVPADADDLFMALATARYGELFSVERVGAHDAIVDLLVVPGGLQEAADAAPAAPTVAHAVLVLGGAGTPSARMAADFDAVASHYRSGAVAVCGVPGDEVQAWFQVLLRELSHNRGLPVALGVARLARERASENGHPDVGDLHAPVLVGDGVFLAGTFIADAAQRLAARLQQGDEGAGVSLDGSLLGGLGMDPALASVRDIGRQLGQVVPALRWINEGGGREALHETHRDLRRRHLEPARPAG